MEPFDHSRLILRRIYSRHFRSLGRVQSLINTKYMHIGVVLHAKNRHVFIDTPSKIDIDTAWELQLLSKYSKYQNGEVEMTLLYQLQKKKLSVFSFLREIEYKLIGSTPPEHVPSSLLHDIHARHVEQMASADISS